MKVTGSATVAAPRERVYEALRDPAVLVRTIPGCRRLEPLGPDSYRMTVSAGVAAVRGTYAGQVALSDPEPPSSFTLRARGQGTPGTVDATVRVTLHPDGEATRVDYDADATVGGMVGGVGQRLLAGAAKKTATEFFTAVSETLTTPTPTPTQGPTPSPMPGPAPTPTPTPTQGPTPGPAPAPGRAPSPAPAPGTLTPTPASTPGSAPAPALAPAPGAPVAYERPSRTDGGARPVAAGVVAGVVAGAAAALAGVALGAVLGRRGARRGR